MPSNCCVDGCPNEGGHTFPKDLERRRLWCDAVRRNDKDRFWQPVMRSTVVCYDHFDESDYVEHTWTGTVPLQRKLKSTAVPHIFPWTKSSVLARNMRAKKRQQQHQLNEAMFMDVAANLEVLEDLSYDMYDGDCVIEEVKLAAKEVQTSYSVTTLNSVTTETQTTLPLFGVERFYSDDEAIHFYTGMETFAKVSLLMNILGPAANELSYYSGSRPSLSIENQLFLTLMKLRRHKTDFELSRFFEVSERTVANIYITWINFMACELSELDIWPSRDLVHYYMPKDFESKFPKTRVILDGVETPIQKPKQPIAQQATFSSYKNRNTTKAVAGSTPGGLVSYVSSAYGGSTSDRQIIERGQLPQMCDPGDTVMADKGFNVQDLFVSKNVELNIPTFFRKTNRLSSSIVIKDRRIASKRVHIERIIGLAKTFKILTEPMNNTESSLATKITQLCFFLCNFRSCIVSNEA